MKTRNSPLAAKKAPAKKTPPKPSPTETTTPTSTSAAATPSSTAPTDTSTPKSGPSTVPKQQQKTTDATPKVSPKPKVEEATPSAATTKVAPGGKKVTRVVKTIVKKKVAKPTSTAVKAATAAVAAAAAATTPKSEVEKQSPVKEDVVNVEGTPKIEEEHVKEPAVDVAGTGESLKEAEQVGGSVDESSKKEESVVEEPVVANVAEPSSETVVQSVEKSPKKEEVSIPSTVESPKKVVSESAVVEEEQVVKGDDGDKAVEGIVDTSGDGDNVEEQAEVTNVQPEEEKQNVNEVVEEQVEQEGFEEPEDEEGEEDNVSEPEEEAKGLEEHMEISAIAKERKSKKEQEIFVGGLDRDTVEEDIKKVFDSIGEVVDVRLHKNPSTKKNKGYAFVKFANKEQASKALSELKNPLIRGKRCGVAPSEDNDTLFVGNICNTWTKEAIKKKLKEYGLEGVENVTLVADPQHEGLSRGFSFVEFSCHADAMLAYKRLQKPDVVFGHAERTVKVAFAEPLREPDPEVMAQVKSVFIDGLPPYWDEERVREHFKPYGEIERIVLARNMPSAKRKDFGFVDFTTHDAAIACINGVNNTELGDEKSKAKVKVRLSNPLPKTQAVKGGLCGGFRIGRAGSGFSRFGRGLGQGGRSSSRGSFQRGKDSHARGRGQSGRFAFAGENISEGPHSGFRGRRPFGGRGGFAAGGRRGYNEEFSSRVAAPSKTDIGRSRYGAVQRGRGGSTAPRRQPFSPEERFSRPVGGSRHYVDDPYLYEEGGYGLKRPYSMVDHEPGYLEPNRLRPRFDHPDPAASSREARYQESFGAGSSVYSPDYYSSTYGGGAYSSMYGGDRSYGGRYYY